MAEREAYIAKRRTVLKDQITSLRGMIAFSELDPANVQLRFKRITELFHVYEELHIELELIQELPENDQHYQELQNSFYKLGVAVEVLPIAGGSRSNAEGTQNTTGLVNSTFIEHQKSVKLLVADLPKFNGDQRE